MVGPAIVSSVRRSATSRARRLSTLEGRDRDDDRDRDACDACSVEENTGCVDGRGAIIVAHGTKRRGRSGGTGGTGGTGGASVWRCVKIQEVSGALEIRAARGTQEAIVPDLGEATGEDVLEESRDERVHREGETSGLVRARVGVAEGDPALVESVQAVVGERDAVDVAREIERGLLAAADRLEVDRPGFLPHARIDRAAQSRTGQRIAHLRAKDRGEGVAGHEESRMSGRDPRGAIGREPTGGDEEVRVGMVVEGA